MSAQTKNRNTRSNPVKETPGRSKNEKTPTRPQSIIRTRHQAVQDANPGLDIKRRPTPGVFYKEEKGKNDEKSSQGKGNKSKSVKSKAESEDDSTPKRGISSKVTPGKTKNTQKKTPNNASSNDKNAKSSSKQNDKKETPKGNTEVIKRGRGRPKKILAGGTPDTSVIVGDSSDDTSDNDQTTSNKKKMPQNNGDPIQKERSQQKKLSLGSTVETSLVVGDSSDDNSNDSKRETRRKSTDNNNFRGSRKIVASTTTPSVQKKTPVILRKSLNETQSTTPMKAESSPKIIHMKSPASPMKVIKRNNTPVKTPNINQTKEVSVNSSDSSEKINILSPNKEPEKKGRGRQRKQLLVSDMEKDNDEEESKQPEDSKTEKSEHSVQEDSTSTKSEDPAKPEDPAKYVGPTRSEDPTATGDSKQLEDSKTLVDSQATKDSKETETLSTPEPRKRGRPRKYPLIDNTPKNSAGETSAKKGKKKEVIETEIVPEKINDAMGTEMVPEKIDDGMETEIVPEKIDDTMETETIPVEKETSSLASGENTIHSFEQQIIQEGKTEHQKQLPTGDEEICSPNDTGIEEMDTTEEGKEKLDPDVTEAVHSTQSENELTETTDLDRLAEPDSMDNDVTEDSLKMNEAISVTNTNDAGVPGLENKRESSTTSSALSESDGDPPIQQAVVSQNNTESVLETSNSLETKKVDISGLADQKNLTTTSTPATSTNESQSSPETDMLDILASACLSQSQTVNSSLTSTSILESKMINTQASSVVMQEPLSTPVLENKDMSSKVHQPEDAVLISPEAPKPLNQATNDTPPITNLLTSTTTSQADLPKVDVISTVNASLEQEEENTWSLNKMINLFIQWQNTDAMCWLDVVLAILAHSPTLKEMAKNWVANHQDMNKNGNNVRSRITNDSQDSLSGMDEFKTGDTDVSSCVQGMLNKVCNMDENSSDTPMAVDSDITSASEKQSEPLVKNPFELIKIPSETTVSLSAQSTPVKEENKLKSKLKFPVIITLIKAHEQAQYLLQNFLSKPVTQNDTIVQEGNVVSQSSSNPQTGAGIKIISPLLTMLHKQPNSGIPVDALTRLGESISKLEDVREVVWDILQPRLKCEKGKNDSPVFALPLLVRESQELKHMFSIEYSLVFHCNKCDYRQENKFVKALPSLPNVPDNFSMKEPAFIRSCFRCEEPGQRMLMKIHSMRDIAMLHFIQGLPRVVYDDLDFDFEGTLYSVTAVVQYKNNPDHFVAWIRNAQENQWMECDDLKSPLCQFENAPPRIPPEQIHIVMWEKNLSGKPSHNLENSKTAGLLSTLLMSTRMVTVTSEGNSKVLTTVPIQYTPVVQVNQKRKQEETTSAVPRPKISVYSVKTPRPNIISSNRMSSSPVTIVPTQTCVTQVPPAPLPETIQKAMNDVKEASKNQVASPSTGKTKVVIVGPKQNQVLGGPVPSNEMKTVSIGGRIVKLTNQQLNAIRSSPGARVSIVGLDGTTTFSIKGVQESKPAAAAAESPKTNLLQPGPEKTETQLQSSVSTAINTITSTVTNNQASPIMTAQAKPVTQSSLLTVNSTTSPQTILLPKTTLASNPIHIVPQNQQSLQQPTLVTTPYIQSTTTLPTLLPTSSNTSTSSQGYLDNKVVINPNRPCRVVVNAQGQVTALASNNSQEIIPLTSDKSTNRAILQKFFSQCDENELANNLSVQQQNSSQLKMALTRQSPFVRSPATPTAHQVASVSAPQHDATSLETAMAVDSISSPSSKQDLSVFVPRPARGRASRGARGGKKPTKPRGRGRGYIADSPVTTPKPYYKKPNIMESTPTSTVTPTSTAALKLQNTISGRQIHTTPRKVAIPTNNGHILLDVPAGRNAMDCLKDPNIVKRLVKNLPTNAVISSSPNISTVASSTQESVLGNSTSPITNQPSIVYNKPSIQLQSPSTTPKSSIRSISIPYSQESKIKEILAKHTSQMSKKPVIIQKITKKVGSPSTIIQNQYGVPNQSPGSSQSDVLSAALMESGVQEDTATFTDESLLGAPATHGLDILSQGVAAASRDIYNQDIGSLTPQSQSMDILTQTINTPASQGSQNFESLQQQSHALDILMQGINAEPLIESTANTQSAVDESQAMSILTGGIAPTVPSSQGLDILTQGLNPPPVSQSQALDILTQGITPRIQTKVPPPKKVVVSRAPKTDLNNLPSQLKSASMKIGQIGATSGKNPIIISSMDKSSFLPTSSQGTKLFTIKSNGNNSSEIIGSETISHGPGKILNSGFQSNRIKVIHPAGPQFKSSTLQPEVITTVVTQNKEVVINPPQSSIVMKRKATNEFVNTNTKKVKTASSMISSIESEIPTSSPRTAQDLFSSIESGTTEISNTPKVRTIYFDPTDSSSQYIIGSSESEYEPNDLVPVETSSCGPVSSEGITMDSLVSSSDNNIFSKFGMTTLSDPREAEVLQHLYDVVSSAEVTNDTLSSPVDSVLGTSVVGYGEDGLPIGQAQIDNSNQIIMTSTGMENLDAGRFVMGAVEDASATGHCVETGMEALGPDQTVVQSETEPMTAAQSYLEPGIEPMTAAQVAMEPGIAPVTVAQVGIAPVTAAQIGIGDGVEGMVHHQVIMGTNVETMGSDQFVMATGVETMVTNEVPMDTNYVAMSENVVAMSLDEQYNQGFQQVMFEEEIVSVAENVEI